MDAGVSHLEPWLDQNGHYVPAIPGEASVDYAERLEELGAPEFAIRSALRLKMSMTLEEAVKISKRLETARLRQVAINAYIHERSDYSRNVYIQRSFSVDEATAKRLIDECQSFRNEHRKTPK